MINPDTPIQATPTPQKRKPHFLVRLYQRINPEKTLLCLLAAASRIAPGYLLSFSEIMMMPSGFSVAYLTALAACGVKGLWPAAGCLFAMLCRLIWGIPVHYELLVSIACCLVCFPLLRRRGNVVVSLFTGAALLPLVIVSAISGTARDLVLCIGSTLTAMLSAPVLLRAIQSARGKKLHSCIDAKVAGAFFGCLLLAGSARLSLPFIHIGTVVAATATCALAMDMGAAAGLSCAMISGLVLALQGSPIALSVALSTGAFLAGTAREMDRRFLTCCAFSLGAALLMILAGVYHNGYLSAVLAASLIVALTPRAAAEKTHDFWERFVSPANAGHDSYAADALSKWEKTVAEMARAVPSPDSVEISRDASWWQQHLCYACPDCDTCEVMQSAVALRRAEEVWESRNEEEGPWQEALENLRGLGCGRLYCLRSGMDALRRDQLLHEKQCKQARYQHDMLVTHLTALSGAAKRYAALSYHPSWWEEMYARRLRIILSENAVPATLLYLRKIEGHPAAALEAHSPEEAIRLQNELTQLVSSVLQVGMYVSGIDADRIYMREITAYSIRLGVSERGAQEESVTGDSTYTGMLDNGGFIAALSDGMGQGSHAGYESSATVNLLRLCLEAGYSRDQAITAVNGMMLLETGGERFATADLLSVNLWNGHAHLDKLGAAGSWLLRGSTLVQLSGDALPVGIMETVESRASLLRLRHGDCLVMMTDGVEDAFDNSDDLERAIRRSLELPDPNSGAEYLTQQAVRARSKNKRDDMTVLIMQVSKNRCAS